METTVNRRIDRGATTREHLVAVATELFTASGFEHTSIEAVLAAAEVSRGSLYHHFASKAALFEAVFLNLEEDVGERTRAAAEGAPSAAAALRAGCLAWVRLAREPSVRRIILVDAPAVLGWARLRALQEDHALGTIRAGLRAGTAEGRLSPAVIDVLAHALLATLNEIVLLVARSDEDAVSLETAEIAIDTVLGGLLDD